MLNVVSNTVEEGQTVLLIEIEPETVIDYENKARAQIRKDIRIPGFRPGKAPNSVIDLHYGAEKIRKRAVNALTPVAVAEACRQEDIGATFMPQVTVKQQQPLTLKVELPRNPLLDLGNYKEIRVMKPELTVTDDKVQEAIDNIRMARANWVAVEGPLELGDLVTINATSVDAEGNVFWKEGERSFLAAEDNVNPVIGFAQQLAGMSVGDTRSFVLTVPDGHSKTEFIGHNIEFTVSIIDMKRKQMPQLDTEFVQSLGDSSLTDEVTLRQRVKITLLEATEENSRRQTENKALTQLVDGATFELSRVLIERETTEIVDEHRQHLAARNTELTDYINQGNNTPEEYWEQARQSAERRLKVAFALTGLAKTEGLKVTDAEVEEAVQKHTLASTSTNDEDPETTRTHYREALLRRLAVKKLIEIATHDTQTKTGDTT